MRPGCRGQCRVCLLWLALAAVMSACGSSPQSVASPKSSLGSQLPKDDRSSCEAEGRGDRDVVESRVAGSNHSNVRRVYGLIGEGEFFRRVLLCREVDTNLDGYKDVVRTYSPEGEKLREYADADYNGRVDTWITFANGRIVRVDVDKTGDGKADEARFYVNGKTNRAQRDTNGDGKPDVWEVYQNGRVQRIGVDLDYDGHVDRWDRDQVAVTEGEADTEQGEAKADPQATEGGAPSGSQSEPK